MTILATSHRNLTTGVSEKSAKDLGNMPAEEQEELDDEEGRVAAMCRPPYFVSSSGFICSLAVN